jgi:hypothetical protein
MKTLFGIIFCIATVSSVSVWAQVPATDDDSDLPTPSDVAWRPLDDVGCIKANQINSYGTNLVKKDYRERIEMFHSSLTLAQVQGTFGSGQPLTYFYDFEGWIRPEKSGKYIIFRPLMLEADFMVNHNAAYVCAHSAPGGQHDYITIYFLQGTGLERKGFSNHIDNAIFPKDLKVGPIPISALGIGDAGEILFDFLDHIPLVNIFSNIAGDILSLLEQKFDGALASFAGLGVERITIRPTEVEFASSVNLNNPKEAKYLKIVPITTGPTVSSPVYTAGQVKGSASFSEQTGQHSP